MKQKQFKKSREMKNRQYLQNTLNISPQLKKLPNQKSPNLQIKNRQKKLQTLSEFQKIAKNLKKMPRINKTAKFKRSSTFNKIDNIKKKLPKISKITIIFKNLQNVKTSKINKKNK